MILDRFENGIEAVSAEIADIVTIRAQDYGAIRAGWLRAEILEFTREHLRGFLETARSGGSPSDRILAVMRGRAVTWARRLLPLPAMIRAFMVAQRRVSKAIATEGGVDGRLREAVARLMLLAFDYSIAVTAALAEAYMEVVHGDLSDLAVARRGLVDALLTPHTDNRPELLGRAVGSGFDPDRSYVVTQIVVDDPTFRARWSRVARAITRATGRIETNVFVVPMDPGLIALLDSSGPNAAAKVLGRAVAALGYSPGTGLRAGIGTPFAGLRGLATSYHEARRALRHATERRPIVHAPEDIPAFDELLLTAGESVGPLIPPATQAAIADDVVRDSIVAFFDANLNVAQAASTLGVHPNSMRYRLERVAALTGRDPRKLTDLVELMVAIRLSPAARGESSPSNWRG